MGNLSAAQELLLAAADLSRRGCSEFTEWDLTVRAWELNRNRFGCRGYEQRYPDHKRVMMELMGKTKPLVQNGWLEKTRPNHYRITPLGLAAAAKLAGVERTGHRREAPLYDAIERFAFHRVFEAYLGDPEEPRTWLGAAAFLSLSRDDPGLLRQRIRGLRSAIREAEDWMGETGQAALRRGDGGRSVSRERLRELATFVDTLEERFARQFEAILGRHT